MPAIALTSSPCPFVSPSSFLSFRPVSNFSLLHICFQLLRFANRPSEIDDRNQSFLPDGAVKKRKGKKRKEKKRKWRRWTNRRGKPGRSQGEFAYNVERAKEKEGESVLLWGMGWQSALRLSVFNLSFSRLASVVGVFALSLSLFLSRLL